MYVNKNQSRRRIQTLNDEIIRHFVEIHFKYNHHQMNHFASVTHSIVQKRISEKDDSSETVVSTNIKVKSTFIAEPRENRHSNAFDKFIKMQFAINLPTQKNCNYTILKQNSVYSKRTIFSLQRDYLAMVLSMLFNLQWIQKQMSNYYY